MPQAVRVHEKPRCADYLEKLALYRITRVVGPHGSRRHLEEARALYDALPTEEQRTMAEEGSGRP